MKANASSGKSSGPSTSGGGGSFRPVSSRPLLEAPQPGGHFQFGLRGLMLLVTACCVYFALERHFGGQLGLSLLAMYSFSAVFFIALPLFLLWILYEMHYGDRYYTALALFMTLIGGCTAFIVIAAR